MPAGAAVGAAAGAERDLAQFEVLLEFLPFLIGGLAVFGCGAGGSPLAEECLVGADQVVLEDGEVGLGGGEAVVAEQAGCDVNGEATGDGFGGEHPAEVVRGVVQGLAGCVTQPGSGECIAEHPVHGCVADHLASPPVAEAALEQVGAAGGR